MAGTAQQGPTGPSSAATVASPLRGSADPATASGRHGRLRRAGRHAITLSILPAALLTTLVPPVQALATQAPAVATLATHATAPAPQPQVAGQQGQKHYYYATAFDSGLRSNVGPNTVQVQFYAQSAHLINQSDHSLTEIFTRDAAGNAVELGVTTDTFWLPNAKPHLFVSSWTAGKWNGYDTNAGFVSTSPSATPGVTEPPLNKYTEYGYTYTQGRMWVSYNNAYIGYFRTSIWRGGWGTATESQTYAEVYASDTSAKALPTMSGAVRNYTSSTGSHFTDFTTSAPYKIHGASGTGFGFSGGNR
jgi:hypothetical protein